MAPPFLFSGLSVTITMLLFFVFLNPRPMNVSNWSTSVLSSGMMAASAPEAIALFCARKPASRPHYFDKEDTVMGGCRVPDFIHAFHNGVQCRIISYGKIGTI